jgi:hypothetical protein
MHTTSTILSQVELMALLTPYLLAQGQPYKKIKRVLARPAVEREPIATITSDGLETNTAKQGDIIVQNTTAAGEYYILPHEKFEARYTFLAEQPDGWSLYESTGSITAIELTAELLQALQLPEVFQFTARWGEAMKAEQGDFLATPPDYQEVYRIARKEFFETYALFNK